MANVTGQAEWLNAAREDDELLKAARFLVKGGYARVSEEIRKQLEPLPDVPDDTAAVLLRDAINARRILLRVAVEDGKPEYDPGTDPWASLAQALLDDDHRKRYQNCERCGRAYSTVRSKTKYCSDRCRVAAYERRLKSASHVAPLPIKE